MFWFGAGNLKVAARSILAAPTALGNMETISWGHRRMGTLEYLFDLPL